MNKMILSLQKNRWHLCVLCASARKQDVKPPVAAGLSARQKYAATVRSNLYYI